MALAGPTLAVASSSALRGIMMLQFTVGGVFWTCPWLNMVVFGISACAIANNILRALSTKFGTKQATSTSKVAATGPIRRPVPGIRQPSRIVNNNFDHDRSFLFAAAVTLPVQPQLLRHWHTRANPVSVGNFLVFLGKSPTLRACKLQKHLLKL
jgi:hypothetical protein